MMVDEDSSSTDTPRCIIRSLGPVTKRGCYNDCDTKVAQCSELRTAMCTSEDSAVKKRKRGSRGGRNEKRMSESQQLLDEVIELLRSNGFSITFPDDDQSITKSAGHATVPKETDISKALRSIMESHCPKIVELRLLQDKLATETAKRLKLQKKIERLNHTNVHVSKTKKTKTRKDVEMRHSEGGKKKQEQVKKIEKKTEGKKTVRFADQENISRSEKKKTLKDAEMGHSEAGKKKDAKKVGKKTKGKKTVKTDDQKKNEESKKRNEEKLTFPKYIRKQEMLETLKNQDQRKPTYIKGHLRINPRDNLLAYITIDREVDILVSGIRNRNRALEGDLVAAMINPEDDWILHESGETQKTGTVLCILERIHPRKVVGTLEIHQGRLRMISRDQRVPILFINPKSVPADVRANPVEYINTLFSATISEWDRPYNCKGTIESIIGEVSDLDGETKAILLTNGLDVTPYGEELLEGLPSSDYVPSASDLEGREDWRNECVFTIDPATAVDLDDAVSCKKLPNGNFEVGVHISDVTHYLKAFSPLDEEVSKRATTVYLVNTVYHMLPKSLCNVCSLLPGQDKLSFSVVWEMTPEAKVVKHRFAKSVIKSCYQMSYKQAQSMIEESTGEWTAVDLTDLESDEPPNQIREVVSNLYKLSSQLRERRFADGALSINQPKLQILLDKESRIPISYCVEERQESNKLIEEFMLLANMTVAKHLYENMGDVAFLRSHGEPLSRTLTRTAEDLARLGIILDIESAAALQASLTLQEKSGLETADDEFATNCRMMVINCLVAQSMPRAKYLCSGKIEELEDLRHFALNVPFYTHFTSPIRRYADIVVHRLLQSSLTNTAMPDPWSADLCAKFAANCNQKKYSAKIAQEKSNELYFMDLLSRNGPTETLAIVMKVQQRCMYVILCHVGITIRMSYSVLKNDAECEYNKELSVPTVTIKWKNPEFTQTINVFSIVNLRVEKDPKYYSIRGVLLPTRLEDPIDCE